MRLLQEVGVGAFLDVAVRAGLAGLVGKSAGDLSLALGSGEVRLLDLTAAYGALAAGGVRHEPAAILRVEDASGRVLWSWTEDHALSSGETSSGVAPGRTPAERGVHRVLSPQVAYILTDILSDNHARAVSFGMDSPLRLSRPAAAKTGTTTDWRDNWTVGYTPDLVAGVWVGNADGGPMRGVSGISGAGPIWHDFMEEALKGRPAVGFVEPPGLVRREVCPESGNIPSPRCPNRRLELFVEGTEPTATCDWHRPVRIDRLTGLLATPGCPSDLVEERVFLVVPPELQAWARERGMPEPPTRTCTAHGPVSPLPGRPRLLLTSPAQGAVLQISPDLPRSLQRVEVAAAGSGLGEQARVRLLVDGVPMESFDSPPYRATWELVPGRHLFRAVAVGPADEPLAWDEVAVTVEDPPNVP